MTDRERLEEATALLERWANGSNQNLYQVTVDTRAWLKASRAPVQPARIQPTIAELTEQWDDPQSHAYGAAQDDSAPAQPAAPTLGIRDFPASEYLFPRPAAPEPSGVNWTAVRNADLDSAMKRAESAEAKLALRQADFALEFNARVAAEAQLAAAKVENTSLHCQVASLCAQLALTKEAITTARREHTEQFEARWRAEAQIAAVLQVCVMAEESEYRGGSLHALRRIRALLTAPSPGEGEETL